MGLYIFLKQQGHYQPAKKFQLTLIGSLLCTFQWA